MRRLIILAAVLSLSACEELGLPHMAYDGRVTNARLNPMWQNSGFTSQQAEEFEKNGIATPSALLAWNEAGLKNTSQITMWAASGLSPETSKKFIDAGFNDPMEASAWERELFISEKDISSRKLEIYKKSVDKGEITLSAIKEITNSGVPINKAEYIILISLKVHNGMSIPDAKISLENEAKKHNKDNFISSYGQDVYNQCGMNLIIPNLFFPSYYQQNIDPYSYKGKCFLIGLPTTMTSVQWISSNQLLIPSYPMLVIGDDHVRLGHNFIAIGLEPQQYTTVMNAVQTPVTVKILRYLD